MFNTLKPPLGARVVPGHPMADGLVGCWLMNEGDGNVVQDLVSGRSVDLNGAFGWEGQGIIGDASDYISAYIPELVGDPQFTLFVQCNIDPSVVSDDILFGLGSVSAAGESVWVYHYYDDYALRSSIYGGSNVIHYLPVPERPYTDRIVTLSFFGDQSGIQVGINGQIAENTNTYGSAFDLDGYVHLGKRGDGSANIMPGTYTIWYVYDRILPISEQGRLSMAPYAMFEPDPIW